MKELNSSSPEINTMIDTIDFGGDKNQFTKVLKEIFRPNISTLGHGTRPELAAKTLTEGLESKYDDLGTTTIPLSPDHTISPENHLEQVYQEITHWPHQNAKAVVVIGIPNPPENTVGGKQYFNSVFEPLNREDTGTDYNNQYVIPPNYIMGYIDAEKGIYYKNLAYTPAPIEVKSENAQLPIPKLNNSIEIPIPQELTGENSDIDVW